MKKSDIAMIILIASVSMMIAYFVANSMLGGGGSGYSQKVKTVDKIDSKIVAPDSNIFNKNAINPSVEVQINPSGAKQPGTQ
jgi:hypothetical protein